MVVENRKECWFVFILILTIVKIIVIIIKPPSSSSFPLLYIDSQLNPLSAVDMSIIDSVDND